MRSPVSRFNSNIITSKENCRNIQYFHIKIVERGIPSCYSQVLLAAGQLTTFIPNMILSKLYQSKKLITAQQIYFCIKMQPLLWQPSSSSSCLLLLLHHRLPLQTECVIIFCVTTIAAKPFHTHNCTGLQSSKSWCPYHFL